MRLALRTLIWITLAVAVGLGWFIEHKRAAQRFNEAKRNAFFWLAPDTGPSEESRNRKKRLEELGNVSNDELRQLFAAADSSEWPELYSEYDLCLIEMARRKMTADLQQAYDRLMANRTEFDSGRRPYNTKLLIALRRSQGQPDPLKVHLSWKHRSEPNRARAMPLLVGTIENIDSGKQTVDFLEGMDDRSGRQTRWRVHLYDEFGKRVPDSNFGGPGIGGGLGTFGALAHGEKGDWSNWLDARCYVKPPPSGKYRLQIIHSPDSEGIAGESDLTGLIVIQSDPIDVVVTGPSPRPAERKTVSVLPLLAVLSTACAVSIVVYVAGRRTSRSAQAASHRWLTSRDMLVLLAITLLSVAWHFDVNRLENKTRGLQPDDHSDWTMRPAESDRR